MEIKLPVYEKREVVKTYTAETYDILFGTVEDLINVLDLESFTTGKDADLVKGVARAIPGAFGMIKPLLKDIFPGLTDEELRNCKAVDIARALVSIIKYSVAQIMSGATEKN